MTMAARAIAVSVLTFASYAGVSVVSNALVGNTPAFAKDGGGDHGGNGGGGGTHGGGGEVHASADHQAETHGSASGATPATAANPLTAIANLFEPRKDDDATPEAKRIGKAKTGLDAASEQGETRKDGKGGGKGLGTQRALTAVNDSLAALATATAGLADAEAALAAAKTPEDTATAKAALDSAKSTVQAANEQVRDAEAEAAEQLAKSATQPVTAASVTDLATGLGIALTDPAAADAIAALAALERQEAADGWQVTVTQ